MEKEIPFVLNNKEILLDEYYELLINPLYEPDNQINIRAKYINYCDIDENTQNKNREWKIKNTFNEKKILEKFNNNECNTNHLLINIIMLFCIIYFIYILINE